MKYTNKYNLPEPFVSAVVNDPYTKGDADFSVTELLSPPQIVRLQKEHDDKLVVDVSDSIMTLLGSAVHKVLEEAEDPHGIPEQRMSIEVGGYTVSGAIDRMERLSDPDNLIGEETWEVEDYKVTSTDTVKFNPVGKTEWHQQVNVYAEIARQNGFNVESVSIKAILRDWKKSKMRYNDSYPESANVSIPIELWPREDTVRFIEDRIQLHTQKETPPCTDEDRWVAPTKYAVYKYNASGGFGSKATRVLDSRYDAEAYIMEKDIKAEIVDRPGSPVRCEDWCLVSKFCKQYMGDEGL